MIGETTYKITVSRADSDVIKNLVDIFFFREKYSYFNGRRVIIMSIEKIVLKMATHYHANLIDIHNALHALGLKSDEQAEEFNKKHMMKIVDMYTRRGYDITK